MDVLGRTVLFSCKHSSHNGLHANFHARSRRQRSELYIFRRSALYWLLSFGCFFFGLYIVGIGHFL